MLKIKQVLLLATLAIAPLLNSSAALANSTPGVNKYAWQASLEVVKFMPLASADPASGVIVTDWYSLDNSTQYKLNVYVLSGVLSGNSVRVVVFKRSCQHNNWVTTQVSPELASSLEETILNQAKKLRTVDYQ